MDDKFYEFYEREENTQRRERFFFFIAGATVVILIILGLNIWFNLKEAQANNGYYVQSLAYAPTGASGGGCGMSGGGCGSTGLSSASLPEIQQQALAYYRQQTGDQSQVDVKVQDFGCHVQADVFKNGKKVKSYAFRDGQFNEV